MKEKILIFGIGGHAKSVYDVVLAEGKFEVGNFVDIKTKDSFFLNIPIIHQDLFINSGMRKGIVAIGDNFLRKKVVTEIMAADPSFQFISIVHPKASLGTSVNLGEGVVVMANARINIGTSVGAHSIINTGSIVDHDSVIGNFCSLAPGCTLGGGVAIGDVTAVGLGVIINHNIKIGSSTVIGSGAVVTKNFTNNLKVYGVPARIISKREDGDSYL